MKHHSQDESSEEIIGEWAEKRGIRDQLVIATKVCYSHQLHDVNLLELRIISTPSISNEVPMKHKRLTTPETTSSRCDSAWRQA
jgi:aryl-alcohol dehydrogenase-like predicted oxidoreductase